MRVLAICNIDLMASIILQPWLIGLQANGYEVHVACAPGPYFDGLRKNGFHVHAVNIRRRFNPLVNIGSIVQAWRLIRKYKFKIVNTHSPTGSFVGRIAATLAGVPAIIYTVHGFYFHEQMPVWTRIPLIVVEWILGRVTDQFMFVSEEDRQTALRTRIARSASRTTTIYNGVDLKAFAPATQEGRNRTRAALGLTPDQTVIGIVGRIVKEKGYREFACMARSLLQESNSIRFLVVGDCLPSDRDRFTDEFKREVSVGGMSEHFTFAGFTSDVAEYLTAMDIFVLPSYREGFPRSILEAMASGLPVVTTDIRGCREAVVPGHTGMIVPSHDAQALTDAVLYLHNNPEIARAMGYSGRKRAIQHFDQNVIRKRFVDTFDRLRGALG